MPPNHCMATTAPLTGESNASDSSPVSGTHSATCSHSAGANSVSTSSASGTLVEQFLAAHRAAIGHFEKAREHVPAAAIRTASAQPPQHRLRRRDLGPTLVARGAEEKRRERGQRQRGHGGNPFVPRHRCASNEPRRDGFEARRRPPYIARLGARFKPV